VDEAAGQVRARSQGGNYEQLFQPRWHSPDTDTPSVTYALQAQETSPPLSIVTLPEQPQEDVGTNDDHSQAELEADARTRLAAIDTPDTDLRQAA
jgi:hypothetical protein